MALSREIEKSKQHRVYQPKQSQSFLVNPVEERIFCDDLFSDDNFPVCGINALAQYTWLNPDPERMIMVPIKRRIREIHYNVNTDNAMCVPNQYAYRESFVFLSLLTDVSSRNFNVDFGVFFRR